MKQPNASIHSHLYDRSKWRYTLLTCLKVDGLLGLAKTDELGGDDAALVQQLVEAAGKAKPQILNRRERAKDRISFSPT